MVMCSSYSSSEGEVLLLGSCEPYIATTQVVYMRVSMMAVKD